MAEGSWSATDVSNHPFSRRVLAAVLCGALAGGHGCALDAGSEFGEGEPVASAAGAVEAPAQAILPTDVNLAGNALGTLPGGLEVSADGAASYRLPIWVPPGRAG